MLRFVAAAMVVFMHAGCYALSTGRGECPTFKPTVIGAAGVDIFFVLSGFVIALTGPLATPRPSGALFFWRRWSRVAPVFYLLSIPFILIAIATGNFNLPRTVATFLFWPAAGPHIVAPFIEAGWTLGFEMLFYSAVAVVLIGGKLRRNLIVLGVLMAALCAARLVSGWNPLRVVANPILLEFGFGVAMAAIWPRLRGADLRLGLGLIGVALAALVTEAIVGAGGAPFYEATQSGAGSLWRVAVFGIPAAALVAGASICDRAISGPISRAAAWLGDASYSIYLSNGFSVPLVALIWIRAFGRSAPLPMGLSIFFGAIAVGALTYVVVERPIVRDLKRVRFGRPVAIPPAAGPLEAAPAPRL
ncbi:MAG: acyltransferase family protein [Caulobacteraceae bacterium]